MPIERDLERRSGAGGAADVWTFRRISVMKLGGGGGATSHSPLFSPAVCEGLAGSNLMLEMFRAAHVKHAFFLSFLFLSFLILSLTSAQRLSLFHSLFISRALCLPL